MTGSKPKTALPVAIAVVMNQELAGEILLIKRVRGAYVGKYALPGGKIEVNEHLSKAVLREVNEETGLNCSFKKYLGVVSELFYKNAPGSNEPQHFLLHVCLLESFEKVITKDQEGVSTWFNLDRIVNDDKLRQEIVASDFLILKTLHEKIVKKSFKENGGNLNAISPDSFGNLLFEHECVMRQKKTDSSGAFVERFSPFGK